MEEIINEPKPASGRPCKFCSNSEDIMFKTEEYLNKAKTGNKEGKHGVPFIEELALLLDIDEDTVNNWATKKIKDSEGKETDELEHPQFFGAIKRLKSIQRLRLQQRTLGRFNAAGPIFLLKANHGMVDRIDITSGEDKIDNRTVVYMPQKLTKETDNKNEA